MKINAVKKNLKSYKTVECKKCKIPNFPYSLVYHLAFDEDGNFHTNPKKISITELHTGIQFAIGRTLKEAKQNTILTVKSIGKKNVDKILADNFKLS